MIDALVFFSCAGAVIMILGVIPIVSGAPLVFVVTMGLLLVFALAFLIEIWRG